MKRLALATAVLMSACLPNAFAADDYSRQFSACMDTSGGVTSNMVDCYNEELTRQDARLNEAYKMTMSAFSAESKTRLRDAQRLWIKFRDADCEIYYTLSGGTMDMLNGADCVLSMTKKRADDLLWLSKNGGE